MNIKPLLAGLLMMAVTLAGCSSDDAEPLGQDESVPELQVTSSTGGIRGVVVDSSIRPIADATVTLKATGDSVVTDETGTYAFSGLEAGTYFLDASHPLYSPAQQSAEVIAGVKAPKPVNFQLIRVIVEDPYSFVQKETGFIACSLNVLAAKSEECGEGVGVDGMGRVGGNPANRAEIQFHVDGPHIKTLLVEQVWEPSIAFNPDESQGLDTLVALDWSCEPVCGGTILNRTESGPPLLLRVDEELLSQQDIAGDTVFSTFSWSAGSVGLMVNQEFEMFITSFYYLPAPADWWFINEEPLPF